MRSPKVMLIPEGWLVPLIEWHSIAGGGKPAFLTKHYLPKLRVTSGLQVTFGNAR